MTTPLLWHTWGIVMRAVLPLSSVVHSAPFGARRQKISPKPAYKRGERSLVAGAGPADQLFQ
jgi:hypothetical protein